MWQQVYDQRTGALSTRGNPRYSSSTELTVLKLSGLKSAILTSSDPQWLRRLRPADCRRRVPCSPVPLRCLAHRLDCAHGCVALPHRRARQLTPCVPPSPPSRTTSASRLLIAFLLRWLHRRRAAGFGIPPLSLLLVSLASTLSKHPMLALVATASGAAWRYRYSQATAAKVAESLTPRTIPPVWSRSCTSLWPSPLLMVAIQEPVCAAPRGRSRGVTGIGVICGTGGRTALSWVPLSWPISSAATVPGGTGPDHE